MTNEELERLEGLAKQKLNAMTTNGDIGPRMLIETTTILCLIRELRRARKQAETLEFVLRGKDNA